MTLLLLTLASAVVALQAYYLNAKPPITAYVFPFLFACAGQHCFEMARKEMAAR